MEDDRYDECNKAVKIISVEPEEFGAQGQTTKDLVFGKST